MKVGDYVKYRSWKPGDQPIETMSNPGFDETGLVFWTGFYKFNLFAGEEPAAEYLTEDGHCVLAAQRDLEVLSECRGSSGDVTNVEIRPRRRDSNKSFQRWLYRSPVGWH